MGEIDEDRRCRFQKERLKCEREGKKVELAGGIDEERRCSKKKKVRKRSQKKKD